MDRRLFVRKSAIGCAIPFLPSSFFAESLSEDRPLELVVSELSELIRSNTIGTIERLSISHIYSPKQTAWSVLVSTARQDFALITQLLGNQLKADLSSLLSDAKPDSFGSFSTRIAQPEMILGWQALAHTNAPTSTPRRSLLLAGNKGVIQLNLTDPSYRIIDFRGKTVAKTSSTAAFRLPV